jgi:hypothetical protein
MTPSPAYRVCLERLERVLSPRVASRSLHAAMRLADVSASDARVDQLEPILKHEVFKQLQVAMRPDDARDFVVATLDAMREAADARPEPVPASAEEATLERAAPVARHEAPEPDGDAPSPPREATAADAEPLDADAYARLRDAARPYNLYFAWPEVRRLRALLARLDAIARGEADDDDAASLLAEAGRSLEAVHQTLEDRLVLQAGELARLQEAYEEVADVGGSKVRRLAALIERVRDAQDDRQLADAELERAGDLARDLRKLVASSVYQSGAEEAGDELEARIRALDVDAELAELDRLTRSHALLLEHREDLGRQLREARDQVASGLTLGDELGALRRRLDDETTRQVREVRSERAELAARLDADPDAWTPDLRREHGVLHDMLADGALPPLADLVRFRERAEMALEQARSAGERAEAAAAETRSRLDLQGDRLERARQALLRYADDADDPRVARLRAAVDRLWSAQVEERIDPDADAAVRAASDALAEPDPGDADGAARAQIASLIDRLSGLPAAIDPEGTAELRTELEAQLDAPPGEERLERLAAAVADAVAAAHDEASRALERLGADAGRWGSSELLDAVRDANEQLEEGRTPALGDLQRRATAMIERTRAEQLDRLHAIERDAARLTDIDDGLERQLADALRRSHDRLAAGQPAHALDDAARHVARLEAALERRLGDVLPRLDAALATFATVERLNSDEVATVRRVLHHLDDQRDAFGRVSPALQARMERSLQEAEDLLATLVEEERATRAIADRLMSGSAFDALLAGFGEDAPAGGEGGDVDAPEGADADGAVDAWLDDHADRGDVVAAGLVAGDAHARRSRGMPADADPGWAEGAHELVERVHDLGRALDLGEPRLIAFEHDDGCLLVGHAPEGTALLAGREPGTLGLLVQELRENDWRRVAARLARREDVDGAPDAG